MTTRLRKAAATNNRKRILIALRDEVWESLTDKKTGGRDIASLAMRWLELSDELDDKTRDGLMSLRDVLIHAIEISESGRDVSAMSRRLIDVLNELDALPDENAKKNAAQKAREMVRNRNATQGKPETDI